MILCLSKRKTLYSSSNREKDKYSCDHVRSRVWSSLFFTNFCDRLPLLRVKNTQNESDSLWKKMSLQKRHAAEVVEGGQIWCMIISSNLLLVGRREGKWFARCRERGRTHCASTELHRFENKWRIRHDPKAMFLFHLGVFLVIHKPFVCLCMEDKKRKNEIPSHAVQLWFAFKDRTPTSVSYEEYWVATCMMSANGTHSMKSGCIREEWKTNRHDSFGISISYRINYIDLPSCSFLFVVVVMDSFADAVYFFYVVEGGNSVW